MLFQEMPAYHRQAGCLVQHTADKRAQQHRPSHFLAKSGLYMRRSYSSGERRSLKCEANKICVVSRGDGAGNLKIQGTNARYGGTAGLAPAAAAAVLLFHPGVALADTAYFAGGNFSFLEKQFLDLKVRKYKQVRPVCLSMTTSTSSMQEYKTSFLDTSDPRTWKQYR